MIWDNYSCEILTKYYNILGPTGCSEILKTSPSSVRAKASRLGLSKSINKTHEQFCTDLNAKGIFLQVLDRYVDGDSIIQFKCFYGHTFKQRPRSVIERSGRCPICTTSGFKDHLPAKLYLIEFPYEDEPLYKLGITNGTPEKRHQQDINKYNAHLCWQLYFPIGKDARDLEAALKKEYADYQYNTGLLKSGNTETFSCYINKPEITC